MTLPPFAYALMRKSERALKSARIDLQHADPDGAVNRAYYGMFNAARATLLAAGVSEGDLPRTHHGSSQLSANTRLRPGALMPHWGAH